MERRHPSEVLDSLLQHEAWLREFAQRLAVDRATAEDLVQETWLAALRNPPDPLRPARPWLRGVLRNLARLRARTETRSLRREERCASAEALPSTVDELERAEIERILDDAVAELDEPYRSTIRLQFFHELTAVEIARRKQVSPSTVRWRTWRALQKLRDRLRPADRAERRWLAGGIPFLRPEGSALVRTAGGLAGAATWKALTVSATAAVVLALVTSLAFFAVKPASEGAPILAAAEHESASTERLAVASWTAVHAARRDALGFAPDPPARTLRIVEHDGSPAAEWPVVLTSGGGTFEALSTDATGKLSSPALAPGVRLFLGRPHAFIEHIALDAEELPAELRLERGRVFEGRILVGGRVPPEPLELALTTDRPLLSEELDAAGLDWPVLWSSLSKGRRARSTTRENGIFRFHGLGDDWSGLLVMPLGYELAQEDDAPADARTIHPSGKEANTHALHYLEPVSGIALELERRPRLYGRVIESGSREPVAGARLHLATSAAGASRRLAEVAADGDGRFEITLPAERLESLALECFDAAGERGEQLELPAEKYSRDLDLGELALAPGRRLTFVVRDPKGRAIQGAVAEAPEVQRPSAATDELGRGSLEGLSARTQAVRVSAPGHHPASVAVPSDRDPSIVAELEPANRLAVAIECHPEDSLEGVVLRVRARDGALFREGMEPRNGSESGRQRLSRPVAPGDADADVLPAEDGSVVLHGVQPGVELRLELLDATGRTLVDRQLQPLAPMESRELRMRVSRRLGALSGVVEIEGSSPLVGAWIEVVDADGGRAGCRTDPRGRFHIAGISSAVVQIEADKPGFEPARIADHAVQTSPAPIQMTLRHAAGR